MLLFLRFLTKKIGKLRSN